MLLVVFPGFPPRTALTGPVLIHIPFIPVQEAAEEGQAVPDGSSPDADALAAGAGSQETNGQKEKKKKKNKGKR